MYGPLDEPKPDNRTRCPLCREKVDRVFYSDSAQPYCSHSPYAGLSMYGPFSQPKQTLCESAEWLHFTRAMPDGTIEHTLIRLKA